MNPIWEIQTIGYVRCEAKSVAEVPSEGMPSVVELDPSMAEALLGIEVGDDIYVITVFDRADDTTMQGSAGTPQAQGAFSIRSSCRPNRIGMTLSRVTGMSGLNIEFEWLDFADGTPVIDLKRYNWRWECVPNTRHLDRRHFEKQISREALGQVLARPARNFHGEECPWVTRVGDLAAELVQECDLWWGDPRLIVTVSDNHHLSECIQGVTGATVGNGRLRRSHSPTPSVALTGPRELTAVWSGDGWVH